MAVKESALQDAQFAFVYRDAHGKKVRKERMDDAEHVRNAIARFRQVKDVTDNQRDKAWARLKRAAKRFGVKVSEASWRDLKASMLVRARSVQVDLPVTNAPNRTPFAGILCVLDEPSTRPPEGADGKCVILSKELAEKLVPTLVGQAVDWKPTLDGHDTQCKVGVITGAEVRHDSEIDKFVIAVWGILYDQDFPDLVPAIRKHQGAVGMSFELGAELGDGPTDETANILDSNGFTGAAILLRKDAAYHKTRLAASREKEKTMGNEITKEDLTSLLAGFKSEILVEVKTLVQAGKKKSGKEMLADDLEAARKHAEKANDLHADFVKKVTEYDPDGDEADSQMDAMKGAAKELGEHLKAAHKHLKSMKADDYMEAEAGKGEEKPKKVEGAAEAPVAPAADTGSAKEIADLKAQVESLTTRLNGQARQDGEPARRTLAPEFKALLAKEGVKVEEGEKPTTAQLYAAMDTLGIKDDNERMALLMRTDVK